MFLLLWGQMKTSYSTTILGFGNHAAIEIPSENLAELGGNKRAPLKVTVNGYTYQSTAAVMDGKCLVVFPTKDREASGVASGDTLEVTLELDAGYRNVDVPAELQEALRSNGLSGVFAELAYSKRKEYARQVAEAKAEDTKARRITNIINALKDIATKQ
jgi:bifunctional DNA-binding transcriptional regulator/antitoxin component of YhaV-PrlF toxin-antitoxin module